MKITECPGYEENARTIGIELCRFCGRRKEDHPPLLKIIRGNNDEQIRNRRRGKSLSS